MRGFFRSYGEQPLPMLSTIAQLFERSRTTRHGHGFFDGASESARLFKRLCPPRAGPRAHRHNRTLSLLMIDLDFLKEVNDRFGHPSGDAVIKKIATRFAATCRETDFSSALWRGKNLP